MSIHDVSAACASVMTALTSGNNVSICDISFVGVAADLQFVKTATGTNVCCVWMFERSYLLKCWRLKCLLTLPECLTTHFASSGAVMPAAFWSVTSHNCISCMRRQSRLSWSSLYCWIAGPSSAGAMVSLSVRVTIAAIVVALLLTAKAWDTGKPNADCVLRFSPWLESCFDQTDFVHYYMTENVLACTEMFLQKHQNVLTIHCPVCDVSEMIWWSYQCSCNVTWSHYATLITAP